MKKFWAIISIVSLFIGFDCSGKEMKVSDVWARASAPGTTTATVYLTIDNKSGSEDTLVNIVADIADTATLQRISQQNGMDQVDALKTLDVAKDENKKLQPHQTYILLGGLKKPLAVGEDFKLKLIFTKEGVIEKTVHVEMPNAIMYTGG